MLHGDCKFHAFSGVTIPPSPPHTLHPLLTISLLGRWSTSGSEGATHISCHYKHTIGGGQEKIKQTNKTLGVNSRAEREYATLHLY